jgi:hypothetical protein
MEYEVVRPKPGVSGWRVIQKVSQGPHEAWEQEIAEFSIHLLTAELEARYLCERLNVENAKART